MKLMTHTAHSFRFVAALVALTLLSAYIAPAGAAAQGAGLGRRTATQAGVSTERTRGAAQTGRRGAATATAPRARGRARLVLLIAVDQFRQDYLERFGDLFVAGGLNRLMRDGAMWTNANYDHVPTETAPGHATMLTGAWPAESGIVGNDWYDRASKKLVSNVQDDGERLFGGGAREQASSPRNLLASTVGDELRLSTAGRAKVIGVSVKDRGAILPAGRMANGAYWYSSITGEFISSSYYFNQMPEWVTRFNATRPADKYFGARWERLLPEAEYVRRAGDDAPTWEEDTPRLKKTFPHVITGGLSTPGPAFYGDLRYAPYTNDMLVSFAEQAIINENLGADADTDVLSVSLSANDYVGHQWGPYSHETMDVTLHTDRQVAALLDIVERRVGLRNTIVAFTADHGVAPVPEHASAMKLPGGRVKPVDVLNAACNAVRARFGGGECKDGKSEYVVAFDNNYLYFDHLALRRERISQEEDRACGGRGGAERAGHHSILYADATRHGRRLAGGPNRAARVAWLPRRAQR